jgi:hypothetical protein
MEAIGRPSFFTSLTMPGEVVEGHYEVYFWLQPPSDVYEEGLRICSLSPVATYGKIK